MIKTYFEGGILTKIYLQTFQKGKMISDNLLLLIKMFVDICVTLF